MRQPRLRVVIFVCVTFCLAVEAQRIEAPTADPQELARIALKEGRVGEAIRRWSAVLATRPDDAAVLREAAQVAGRELRYFEAEAWLRRLTELDPASPANWFDLGVVRFNAGMFDLAIECFRRVEALEATDPEVAARHVHRWLHGRAATALERHAEAIEQYSVARDRRPQDRDIQRALAGACYDAGRWADAVVVFRELARVEPRADHFYGLGVSLGESGDIDGGIRALTEAQRLAPRELRTLVKLGMFLQRKQDLAGAESMLLIANEVAPKNYDVLRQLSQIARLDGRSDEADVRLKDAEALKASIDAMTEKRRVYKRGLVATPNDVDAQFSHGLALLEYGSVDDAELVFARIVFRAPDHLLARLNLATCRARVKDYVAAYRHAVAACDAHPESVDAHVTAGTVAWSLGDLRRALDFYERAGVLAPKDENVQKTLKRCRDALAASSRPRGKG